jgi:hypothetical protein
LKYAPDKPPAPVYVTTWKDSDDVTLLSSYPPVQGTCVRKILEGGHWTAQVLPRPSVVAQYNTAMGGTDLHDMRLAFTRSTVKSRRWQVRVINDMFSSMMMNAFLLKTNQKAPRYKVPKHYSSFDFIAEYLEQVCPAPPSADLQPMSPKAAKSPLDAHPAGIGKNGKLRKFKASLWTKRPGLLWRLDGDGHYSQDANNLYDKVTGNFSATSGKKIRFELRRNCHYCNERTVYLCTKCNAPLCLGACFANFHTKNKLMNCCPCAQSEDFVA